MFDWGKIAKVNFDDERRKRLGLKTGKQLFQESYQRMHKAEEIKAERDRIEPLIKNHLLDHMINHKPIQVVSPISNPTETVGGLTQEDEDDGFYANVKKSNSANVTFQEVMESIPVGESLTFKNWNKTLGQWVFKSDAGKEYAIYDQPLILFQGKQIENPGYFGLLHNTHLRNLIKE